MNREQIIRMAREAGFDPHDMSDDFTCNLVDIERFAALVAAAEREECAQVVEAIDRNGAWVTKQEAAAAIRARSKQCG